MSESSRKGFGRGLLANRDRREEKDLTWSFKLWESGSPDADAPWTGTLASPDELVDSIVTQWVTDYWAHGEIAPAQENDS